MTKPPLIPPTAWTPPHPSGWKPKDNVRLSLVVQLHPHFSPVTGWSPVMVREIDWVRFPNMLLLGFNQTQHGEGLSSVGSQYDSVLRQLACRCGVENVTLVHNRGEDGLGRMRQELHGRDIVLLAEMGWSCMWRFAFSAQFEAKW